MEPAPAEQLEAPPLVLRRYRIEDAPAIGRAIRESLDHLRPWMAWARDEPIADDQRARMIATWNEDWDRGKDFVYGMFVDGALVGGCGLHWRGPPRRLEIGYWLHADHVGQGYATTAARLLLDAGFGLPGVDAIVITHDPANAADAAVPRRLGFTDLGLVDGARRWKLAGP